MKRISRKMTTLNQQSRRQNSTFLQKRQDSFQQVVLYMKNDSYSTHNIKHLDLIRSKNNFSLFKSYCYELFFFKTFMWSYRKKLCAIIKQWIKQRSANLWDSFLFYAYFPLYHVNDLLMKILCIVMIRRLSLKTLFKWWLSEV